MTSAVRKAKRMKKDAMRQEAIRIVEERQKQLDTAMTGDVDALIALDCLLNGFDESGRRTT